MLEICFLLPKFYDFIIHSVQIFICSLNIGLTWFDVIITRVIVGWVWVPITSPIKKSQVGLVQSNSLSRLLYTPNGKLHVDVNVGSEAMIGIGVVLVKASVVCSGSVIEGVLTLEGLCIVARVEVDVILAHWGLCEFFFVFIGLVALL